MTSAGQATSAPPGAKTNIVAVIIGARALFMTTISRLRPN
jgi:hypothetical protein